jgi:hypothetical protein
MFKNTAGQSVTLIAVNVNTGLEATADAANMTLYVQKDDGAIAAIASNAGVPTEISAAFAKGLYRIALSQAETNGDKLLFSGKSTTAGVIVVPTVIYTSVPAADPLISVVPGSYSHGSAGYALGQITGLTGTGSVLVDHNYGGTDALTYQTATGLKIDNGVIWVFLSVDYVAGRTAAQYLVATSGTDVNGHWTHPVLLDPGAYTLLFFKQGQYDPTRQDITVS